MINTKLFKEYADLKLMIKELIEKEALIKEQLVEGLKDDPKQGKDTPWGNFTVSKNCTYTYSEKVEALIEKLKAVKYKEEEKGIAKIKTNTLYIRWSPLK